MHRRGLMVALAAIALLGQPSEVRAQQDCISLGSGEVAGYYNTVIVRAANLRCGDLFVRADSAMLYQQARQYQLFGRVKIDNPDISLRARNAQYDAQGGVINAQGAVDLLRKQDSTRITNGENLVLYRAGSPGRTEDALTVSGGRPHAVLRPRRAEGATPESAAQAPYQVDADRIDVMGQDQFQATGNVQIRRGDLDAASDEVFYQGISGTLRLTGSARLNTEKYDLAGGVIVVTMAGDEISQVISQRNAQLTGDIEVKAGFIQLDLVGGALDELTAGPDPNAVQPARPEAGGAPPGTPARASADTARATATSEDLSLLGTQLIIDVEGDRVKRVDAIGRARMVSFASDSLNAPDTPEIVRRDWMEGDSIVALFASADSAAAGGDSILSVPPPRMPGDSAVAADSAAAKRPRLELLEARGNARALYRLAPADTTGAADPTCAQPGRFAVHYVLGNSITISMGADGVVKGMEVVGQVAGEHLEPPACRAASPSAPATPPAGAAPGSGAPSPQPPLPSGTPPPPGPAGQPANDRRSLQPPSREPEPTPDSR
jgi:lipopolysaccharide export system protein LptA